jgi:CelD/BcsL family acetyltransferase involved in cellulose biosynthesis
MSATARRLRLERLPTFEAAREPWTTLAETSGNVFATWEWASTWWRHLGKDRPLHLTLCRDDEGSPVAVLPLYRWATTPVRVARFVGHGPADQLGPVCHAADRPAVAEALVRATAEACDVLVADELHGDERWPTLVGVEADARNASPTIPIAGPRWDDYLAGRSSSFRKQLRQRERSLLKHGARYRLADDPDSLDPDLDALFALHRARWADGGSEFARHEPFQREFARAAAKRGWLRLWFLEIDASPVAAAYGLRFGDVEWYYQTGRDPAWDRSSPGIALLAHALRSAIEDGVVEYRLGRGDESYKQRFATHDPGVERVVLAYGRAGAVAVAAGRAARRLAAVRRTVRARVRSADSSS